MNFPKSGKEIQSVATAGHETRPHVVSTYGQNSQVAKKLLNVWMHEQLSLLKYFRNELLLQMLWGLLTLGRLRGWDSCPGAVSHPRSTLMVASMKPHCFGGCLLPGQLCGAVGREVRFCSWHFSGKNKTSPPVC